MLPTERNARAAEARSRKFGTVYIAVYPQQSYKLVERGHGHLEIIPQAAMGLGHCRAEFNGGYALRCTQCASIFRDDMAGALAKRTRQRRDRRNVVDVAKCPYAE